MNRGPAVLSGWMCTGWEAKEDGTTDIAIGSYDITGCWHVLVTRDEHGEIVVRGQIERVEDGRRLPEPNLLLAEQIEAHAYNLAKQGKVNILKWSRQRGKTLTASDEGTERVARPMPGAGDTGGVRRTESGDRPGELRGSDASAPTGPDA
jgi:hypothetical protein